MPEQGQSPSCHEVPTPSGHTLLPSSSSSSLVACRSVDHSHSFHGCERVKAARTFKDPQSKHSQRSYTINIESPSPQYLRQRRLPGRIRSTLSQTPTRPTRKAPRTSYCRPIRQGWGSWSSAEASRFFDLSNGRPNGRPIRQRWHCSPAVRNGCPHNGL